MWWWLVVVAMGVETPPEFWATSYVDIRHDDDGSTPCLGLPGGTCAAELDLAIDMINSLACGTAPTVNNDGADPVYPLLFDVNDGINALIFHADPGTFTGDGSDEIRIEKDRVYEWDTVFLANDRTFVASGDDCEGDEVVLATALFKHLANMLRVGSLCSPLEIADQSCPAPYLDAILRSGGDQNCRDLSLALADRGLYGRKYGGEAALLCGPVDAGRISAGLELTCELSSSQTLVSADWDWGDGTTSTGLPGTHTYEVDSVYLAVQAVPTADDGCPIYASLREHEICPAAKADFTLQELEGGVVEFSRVYGEVPENCFGSTHTWEVFDPAVQVVFNSTDDMASYTMDQEGTYTFRLYVENDYTTDYMDQAVVYGAEATGCGCGGGGSEAWLLFALPLWFRRRSKDKHA